MDPSMSNVSGPDWVAAQENPPQAARRAESNSFPFGFQAWGPAALVLGVTEIVFSALTHVVCWLYVSLARGNMSDVDTRLGLTMAILYSLVMLTLAIFGVVAGGLGMRESRRLRFARGVSLIGMLTSCAGLVCWLMASANLLIVAISQLR